MFSRAVERQREKREIGQLPHSRVFYNGKEGDADHKKTSYAIKTGGADLRRLGKFLNSITFLLTAFRTCLCQPDQSSGCSTKP